MGMWEDWAEHRGGRDVRLFMSGAAAFANWVAHLPEDVRLGGNVNPLRSVEMLQRWAADGNMRLDMMRAQRDAGPKRTGAEPVNWTVSYVPGDADGWNVLLQFNQDIEVLAMNLPAAEDLARGMLHAISAVTFLRASGDQALPDPLDLRFPAELGDVLFAPTPPGEELDGMVAAPPLEYLMPDSKWRPALRVLAAPAVGGGTVGAFQLLDGRWWKFEVNLDDDMGSEFQLHGETGPPPELEGGGG